MELQADESPQLLEENSEKEVSFNTPQEGLVMEESEKLSVIQYIQASGMWEFAETIPNSAYLGDIIEAIIESRFPPKKTQVFPPGPHYFPIKICISGSLFTGKHTYAKQLEQKYGIKFFEIEKVLEDRNKVLERKQELEEGKKPKKAQEDESEIFVEECVNSPGDSSKEKARLIRAKLRGLFGDEPKAEEEVKKGAKKEEVKCQGWGILGYPRTAEEAEDLEFVLSGYVDPRHLPLSMSEIKKKEAEIIAAPSGLTERQPLLEKSIFDLIIKLEVPSAILVKRAVDRRVDANGNIYNLSFSPPPDNLLPKLKTLDHPNEEEILKSFEEFSQEKSQLKVWFSKFGIGDWKSFFNVTETKLDLVKEMIEKKIQEWLKIREDLMNKEESTDRKLEFRDKDFVVSRVDAKFFYFQWEELRDGYLSDLSMALGNIENVNRGLEEAIGELLEKFKEFLCREDEKQAMIDPFLEKLKGLLESKAIITSRSRKNMLDELDNLSDQLWDVIESRKNENLAFFENLTKENPSISLGNQVIQCVAAIITAEAKKLVKSTNLVIDFHVKLLQDCEDCRLDDFELNLDDEAEESTEKLEIMIENAKSFTNYLPNCPCRMELSANFLLKIEQVSVWASKTLQTIAVSSKSAFLTMDAWIGDAVLAENKFVNSLIDVWKASAVSRIPSTSFKIESNSNILQYLRSSL